MKKTRIKEEIINDMKIKKEVEKEKEIIRAIFPFLSKQKSIYDAQTAVNALSGFLKMDMHKKMIALKLEDFDATDFKKEPDSAIKKSMALILEVMKKTGLSSREATVLLDKLGNSFGQFGANQFLKGSMKKITVDDIVAK